MGLVEIRFPNGDVYKGSVDNCQLQGEGLYTFKSGTVYEGGFKEGKFEDSQARLVF